MRSNNDAFRTTSVHQGLPAESSVSTACPIDIEFSEFSPIRPDGRLERASAPTVDFSIAAGPAVLNPKAAGIWKNPNTGRYELWDPLTKSGRVEKRAVAVNLLGVNSLISQLTQGPGASLLQSKTLEAALNEPKLREQLKASSEIEYRSFVKDLVQDVLSERSQDISNESPASSLGKHFDSIRTREESFPNLGNLRLRGSPTLGTWQKRTQQTSITADISMRLIDKLFEQTVRDALRGSGVEWFVQEPNNKSCVEQFTKTLLRPWRSCVLLLPRSESEVATCATEMATELGLHMGDILTQLLLRQSIQKMALDSTGQNKNLLSRDAQERAVEEARTRYHQCYGSYTPENEKAQSERGKTSSQTFIPDLKLRVASCLATAAMPSVKTLLDDALTHKLDPLLLGDSNAKRYQREELFKNLKPKDCPLSIRSQWLAQGNNQAQPNLETLLAGSDGLWKLQVQNVVGGTKKIIAPPPPAPEFNLTDASAQLLGPLNDCLGAIVIQAGRAGVRAQILSNPQTREHLEKISASSSQNAMMQRGREVESLLRYYDRCIERQQNEIDRQLASQGSSAATRPLVDPEACRGEVTADVASHVIRARLGKDLQTQLTSGNGKFPAPLDWFVANADSIRLVNDALGGATHSGARAQVPCALLSLPSTPPSLLRRSQRAVVEQQQSRLLGDNCVLPLTPSETALVSATQNLLRGSEDVFATCTTEAARSGPNSEEKLMLCLQKTIENFLPGAVSLVLRHQPQYKVDLSRPSFEDPSLSISRRMNSLAKDCVSKEFGRVRQMAPDSTGSRLGVLESELSGMASMCVGTLAREFFADVVLGKARPILQEANVSEKSFAESVVRAEHNRINQLLSSETQLRNSKEVDSAIELSRDSIATNAFLYVGLRASSDLFSDEAPSFVREVQRILEDPDGFPPISSSVVMSPSHAVSRVKALVDRERKKKPEIITAADPDERIAARAAESRRLQAIDVFDHLLNTHFSKTALQTLVKGNPSVPDEGTLPSKDIDERLSEAELQLSKDVAYAKLKMIVEDTFADVNLKLCSGPLEIVDSKSESPAEANGRRSPKDCDSRSLASMQAAWAQLQSINNWSERFALANSQNLSGLGPLQDWVDQQLYRFEQCKIENSSAAPDASKVDCNARLLKSSAESLLPLAAAFNFARTLGVPDSREIPNYKVPRLASGKDRPRIHPWDLMVSPSLAKQPDSVIHEYALSQREKVRIRQELESEILVPALKSVQDWNTTKKQSPAELFSILSKVEIDITKKAASDLVNATIKYTLYLDPSKAESLPFLSVLENRYRDCIQTRAAKPGLSRADTTNAINQCLKQYILGEKPKLGMSVAAWSQEQGGVAVQAALAVADQLLQYVSADTRELLRQNFAKDLQRDLLSSGEKFSIRDPKLQDHVSGLVQAHIVKLTLDIAKSRGDSQLLSAKTPLAPINANPKELFKGTSALHQLIDAASSVATAPSTNPKAWENYKKTLDAFSENLLQQAQTAQKPLTQQAIREALLANEQNAEVISKATASMIVREVRTAMETEVYALINTGDLASPNPEDRARLQQLAAQAMEDLFDPAKLAQNQDFQLLIIDIRKRLYEDESFDPTRDSSTRSQLARALFPNRSLSSVVVRGPQDAKRSPMENLFKALLEPSFVAERKNIQSSKLNRLGSAFSPADLDRLNNVDRVFFGTLSGQDAVLRFENFVRQKLIGYNPDAAKKPKSPIPLQDGAMNELKGDITLLLGMAGEDVAWNNDADLRRKLLSPKDRAKVLKEHRERFSVERTPAGTALGPQSLKPLKRNP